jgi:hypothetical protein
VNAIDDLHIVEIDSSLDHGYLCLSGRLHKALTWLASLLATTAVCSLTPSIIAVGSACEDATPDDLLTVIVDRDLEVLRLMRIKLEVSIRRLGILPEALAEGSCLDTASSLEAITITVALSVLRPLAP